MRTSLQAQIQAAHTTERQLADWVTQACDQLELMHYHTHDSRRSVAGFPDLVIVGRSGVLLRELKRQGARVSNEQHRWLSRLNLAGADADVWRPLDWLEGRILDQLQAITRVRTR